ncbi:hypothetical protein PInf_007739 [Phytophthora infestans]|nr:hypothetical protein PInf_007739 [Phytophthora infestans]
MPPKKKTKSKKSKASSGGADAADSAVEAASIIDSAPPSTLRDTRYAATQQELFQPQVPHKDLHSVVCHQSAPEGDPEVVCLIHYDFKPEHNPLVLATEKN